MDWAEATELILFDQQVIFYSYGVVSEDNWLQKVLEVAEYYLVPNWKYQTEF